MALTNTLKPLLDIPTWEWSRFAPSNWDGNRPLVTQGDGLNRYLYHVNFISTTSYAYRYDTYTDAWQQMAQSPIAATNTTCAAFTKNLGYAFRVVSAASGTVTGALLSGERLKGATIRVIEGTGAGQVRTISSVADPVIADRGYATAVNQNIAQASFVRDTNKTWTVNQWAGYQMRLVLNTGATVMRRILYNDANTLYFYDPAWAAHSPYEWGSYIVQTLGVTAGTATTYYIESSVATLNSSWTTTPDSTSVIMCETGSMWVASGNAATPFFTFQQYDVAADSWSVHAATANIVTANLPEAVIERTENWGSVYVSRTASGSSTTTSLADSATPGWTANQWANYVVRITGGTGVGQSRVIASNTTSALVPLRAFNTAPDGTSTYEIVADNDKFWLMFNGNPRINQFSVRAQQWVHSRVYDAGVVRALSAVRGTTDNPLEPFPLTSISRTGTTATATTTVNHNLKTGDSVTIAGATGADASLFNGTFTITVTGLTTFTYTMSGTPTGATATPNTLTTAIIVDASKNWTVNELVNKTLQWSAGTGYNQTLSGLAVITANTANTITVATAGTLPVNGQQYAITDGPSFGYDNFTGNATTNGTGLATSGSTTTLVDSTKNWATNEHVNKIVYISAGTGNTQVLTITANTATTLTFGVATAPAANSRYSILNMNSRGPGLGLKWAAYPTVASQGRYLFSFRGGTTLQVDRYDITTQQWLQISAQMSETLALGSMYAYDGVDKIYIHHNATNKITVMDVDTYRTDLYSQAPYGQGTAVAGDRMVIASTSDGLKFLYLTRHSNTEMWRTLLFL